MSFDKRHIDHKSVKEIEGFLGTTKEELIKDTVPSEISNESLNLEQMSEEEFLDHFKTMMDKNVVKKSMIGQGYCNSLLPNVIKRNVLENPSWYTAYTPYQAEISQGRLESLINYQTMISSLTGMEISNASLLDEATAAAEAMVMLYNSQKGKDKKKGFFVGGVYDQTLDVLKSRAEGFGIEIYHLDYSNQDVFGCLIPYQDKFGEFSMPLPDYLNEAPKVVSTDLLALTLFKEPSEIYDNVEVVIGTTQRFGLPMGFGGPHSAFFATKDKYKRVIPGRIIGESIDSKGKKAYRMALQTREQHIRRDKATSNICTSQVLLANISAFYAIYHGPNGLKEIAERIHRFAKIIDRHTNQKNVNFFDTLHIENDTRHLGFNEFNYNIIDDNSLTLTIDETTTEEDVVKIINQLWKYKPDQKQEYEIPEFRRRETTFLEHDVFNKYHTEHELLRYMKRLEKKDISLTDSMISLGSCTMKLNPTTAMIPLSWETLGNIHPFAPVDQVQGYMELIDNMNDIFKNITGFDSFSYQPNSGAQGEYAGLKTIKAYHDYNGDTQRNVVLIPESAHGTNPATAKICGMDIVTVKCTENGDIDLQDLAEKLVDNEGNLCALMVTYPSTHGVFEESIVDICNMIHKFGGQVYMDGANLNAQVGLTNPAFIGADVCHMNLHKTFCIPHGGGGPGLGTIGVKEHLTPFLPQHHTNPSDNGINAIAASHYSSASILSISYAYIKMMGNKLKDATTVAILNANYMRKRLEDAGYKILYKGNSGNVAHEMIVDFRPFREQGIEVVDIAKRLIDYNFHAPTVAFPVNGTLMIEPTESESKEEMDRLCDALIQIKEEIGHSPEILKNAPHTIEDLASWEYDYTIIKACFPLPWVKERKYWSPVNRINDSHGDRNLFCSCS